MRQELFHHAYRPAQIDFNLSSDVFEASSFVVNIDLTHDAGVVYQNVELGKLFGDLFVKSGDRFRIGNVALKGVNFWKGRFRTVHLSLIAARDENRVTKCRELFGEFVTDAAGAAGDQNRIALEFHNYIPPNLWDHRQSCEEALRRSTQTQRPRCTARPRVRAAYAVQPCPRYAARSGRLSSTFPHDVIGTVAPQSKAPSFRALRTLLIGRVRISPLVEFTRPPPGR